MESSKNEGVRVTGGIGFVSLMTIVLITLKLLDKIHWNWFWVLSAPLLGILGLLVGIVLVVFVVFLLAGIGMACLVSFESWQSRRKG